LKVIDRVVNAWGGYSKATTHALDYLQYRGLLRIARRENGIRIYEAAPAIDPLPAAERLQSLILTIAGILAPVFEKTLHANINRYRPVGDVRQALVELCKSGMLHKETVDGMTYIWPASRRRVTHAPPTVRFLAPFDPLVWDRRRFEHFWQWSYRFEAYTPAAKRVRGYYAMPMLWRDRMVGWANAGVQNGTLHVNAGFITRRPGGPEFRREFEGEIVRLKNFLGCE
jgi:uncharacterized protein YcaQ